MTVSGWGGKDSASDAAVGGRTCFSSPPSLISELMFAKVEGNEVGWGAFISQQKNSNSSIHGSLLNHPAPLFFLDLANSDFPVTCLFPYCGPSCLMQIMVSWICFPMVLCISLSKLQER